MDQLDFTLGRDLVLILVFPFALMSQMKGFVRSHREASRDVDLWDLDAHPLQVFFFLLLLLLLLDFIHLMSMHSKDQLGKSCYVL